MRLPTQFRFNSVVKRIGSACLTVNYKHLATAVLISKGARARALQAAGVGMSLAVAAMIAASVGLINATAAAVSQEFIDMAAILWALLPVRTKLKN